MNVRQFWGKTNRPKNTHYHPAIYHMLDVGLVAQALLEKMGANVQRILFEPLGDIEKEQKIRWLAFLVALHDLGKISPGFQVKSTDFCPRNLNKDKFPFCKKYDETDHGRVTWETLREILINKATKNWTIADTLAQTVAAHHGAYHQTGGKEKELGKAEWIEARNEIVETLRECFDLNWQTFPLQEEIPSPTFFLVLAGLTGLADWLGSDKKYFCYIHYDWRKTDFNVVDYQNDRLHIARQRVADLNLAAPTFQATHHAFGELFQFDGKPAEPNINQTKALQIADQLPNGKPALVIIETPMGSGKTEAALAIADRWLSTGIADGIYYALPTQATANAMLSRLLDFLRCITDETQLHLLHAYADLQEEYRALLGKDLPKPAQIDDIHDNDDETETGVRASVWFTERKRGLLSPFAVGTVDQALLTVLKQSRHFFVRLFGLAGKVVIIDEAHAYDTYTLTLLENLLRWLAALQTPVIVLSATLPEGKRQDLLKAYAPQAKLPTMVQYPCVIAAHQMAEQVLYAPIDSTIGKTFQVHIHTANGEQRWLEVANILREQLQDGGCALCVINTVVEAQALFQHLATYDDLKDYLCLFHARFPMGKRLAIEENVKARFGKNPEVGDRPYKAILIATQVVEQSLDVNFDVLITELAPIDLILQRMGRVHRHENTPRPQRLAQPSVYCLLPDLAGDEPDFGKSIFYFENILLRSALVLLELKNYLRHQKMQIQLPDDVPTLIDLVYPLDLDDESDKLNIPSKLTSFYNEATEKQKSSTSSQARDGETVTLPDEDDSDFFYELIKHLDTMPIREDEVLLVKTRLGAKNITLITLHENADSKVFLDAALTQEINLANKPDEKQLESLLRRSVSINDKTCYEYFVRKEIPKGWEKSPLLRYCRPALFHNGELHYGKGKVLRFDAVLGLVLPS